MLFLKSLRLRDDLRGSWRDVDFSHEMSQFIWRLHTSGVGGPDLTEYEARLPDAEAHFWQGL